MGKICRTCKEPRDESLYHRHLSMKDLLDSECKYCVRKSTDKFFRTIKGRFCTLKRVCSRKNISLNLTFDQFKSIVSNPCRYCSKQLDESTTTYFIDRKDNSIGYSMDNVVPCCSKCNFMKGSLNELEFLDQIRKIASMI